MAAKVMILVFIHSEDKMEISMLWVFWSVSGF
jgi:hypothetical protein